MAKKQSCVLESEITNISHRAKEIFSFESQPQKLFKKLFYIAYKLRQFDRRRQFISLQFQYNGEENELYLKISCDLSECLSETVLNSKCKIQAEDFKLDNSFVSRKVCLHEIPSAGSWCETPQKVCEELFDLWKETQCRGILAMTM